MITGEDKKGYFEQTISPEVGSGSTGSSGLVGVM